MALPITLDEAKRQLKLEPDESDQDDEILDFIRDAADWVESYTGHILEPREIVEGFSGFRPVTLRAWPISRAAVPVVDAGAAGAFTARLDVSARPARVLPLSGAFWPFVDSRQSFTVTVQAGYEDPDDVPRGICRAMLVLIGAYDADREGGKVLADAESTARRLCQRLKRHTL